MNETFKVLNRRVLGWVALGALTLAATAIAAAEAWGPSVEGLQMSIALREESTPQAPAFAITIRNGAAGSVRVNLGMQIPAFQSPDNIGLTIVDTQGKARYFPFAERRYGGIAGGVSAFVVYLRPGESHTLLLGLDDFWLRDMTADATSLRGKLQVTATLEGPEIFLERQSPTLLVCVGQLSSNTLQLER